MGLIEIIENEREGHRQMVLDRAADMISCGKKVPAKELGALIRDVPKGVSIPKPVLNHIADRLEGKIGKGRPVSLYQSVDKMFRNSGVRKELKLLRDKHGKTKAMNILSDKYCCSVENIRQILKIQES